MTNKIYTVITFAPVQGFIEKSRKLRDLYGSSYLLSYLSWEICKAAHEKHGCQVISPALPNITQGMPNKIIIEGDFPEENAKLVFLTAWKYITATCREWIEENVKGKWKWVKKDNTEGEWVEDNPKGEGAEDNAEGEWVEDNAKCEWEYTSWKRSWDLWTKYAWEFFWVQGTNEQSISDVQEKLNEKKRPRDWNGINWQGESSTLSGADAIAYPKLGQISDPRNYNYQDEKKNVTVFYQILSQKLGESFLDPKEELSIPELIKRMITYESVSQKLIERLRIDFEKTHINKEELIQGIEEISKDLKPSSFKDLNRHKENGQAESQTQPDRGFQGWFQGDGDKAGDYLKKYPEKTKAFSKKMRTWGKWFKNRPFRMGRVIYAGGDDFLGVFYDKDDLGEKLEPSYCVNWLSDFKSNIWHENKTSKEEKKEITVSVGFVWAFPGIPQRDVLQHCRLAEKSAKSNGRDRIAFRILFNNGNHLEWVCPWWLLEAGLLSSYRDRKGEQNWTHIYNDVAVLESRHAFDNDSLDIALGLLEIYFHEKYVDVVKDKQMQLHQSEADLTESNSGILGDRKMYEEENTKKIDEKKVNKALTNWIINLAKVGFHLCQQ